MAKDKNRIVQIVLKVLAILVVIFIIAILWVAPVPEIIGIMQKGELTISIIVDYILKFLCGLLLMSFPLILIMIANNLPEKEEED